MKKKSTAIWLTIFVYSMFNIWVFYCMDIPQGSYTLAAVISGIMTVIEACSGENKKGE